MAKKKKEIIEGKRVLFSHLRCRWEKVIIVDGEKERTTDNVHQHKGKLKTNDDEIKASVLSAFIDVIKKGHYYDSSLIKASSQKGVSVETAKSVWSSCKDELREFILGDDYIREDLEAVLRKSGRLKESSKAKDLDALINKEFEKTYPEVRAKSGDWKSMFRKSLQQRRSQVKPLSESKFKERHPKDE